MSSGPTPAQLIDYARGVTAGTAGDWGRSWARAAAFLTRTALEDAVATLWSGPLTSLRATSTSSQLLCLPTYLGDDDLARRVHATWAQLSTACHAHAYELPPTVGELRRWIDVVDRLVAVTSFGATATTR